MKRTFTILVERDPESGWLVGEVAELPGCYTQAPDIKKLEENIKEAISAYLGDKAENEPLPEFIGTLRVEVGT